MKKLYPIFLSLLLIIPPFTFPKPVQATAKATGGTYTESDGYGIHTFTSDSTFNPSQALNIEVLSWGAGGGSGGSGSNGGGGGFSYSHIDVTTDDTLTVKVGGGGTQGNSGCVTNTGGGAGGSGSYGIGARGGNAGTSGCSKGGGGGGSGSFVLRSSTILVAAGGGGGGAGAEDGGSTAGPGGGGGVNGTNGSCTSIGGTTGGSGTSNGTQGGDRLSGDGSGSGGGGGGYLGGTGGTRPTCDTTGGAGGAGGTNYGDITINGSGTTPGNTGDPSNGGVYGNGGVVNANGTAGLVVIRYPLTTAEPLGGTYSTDGTYGIHTFTGTNATLFYPAWVTTIEVFAWGGGGGSGGNGSNGGGSGYANSSLSVSSSNPLKIHVGGKGYLGANWAVSGTGGGAGSSGTFGLGGRGGNAGPSGSSRGGGGAGGGSFILNGSTILVAAAGGGGGAGAESGGAGAAGGGGVNGTAGTCSSVGGTTGGSGTSNGTQGGDKVSGDGSGAGAGGGGYLGGTGGTAPTCDGTGGGGGAGGTNYGDTTANGSGTTPGNSGHAYRPAWSGTGGVVNNNGGNGIIVIRYLLITPPNAPTIAAATVLSDTSIRWNFTDGSDNEDGFKIYDENNVLKVTCATANLGYCDETGLTSNTSYTRKVVAYNGGGNSGYSSTANATTQTTSCQPSLAQSTHTITASCHFPDTIIDSTNGDRVLTGILGGDSTDNTSTLTIASGTLTINANQTVVAGSIILDGGSITIAEGGIIELDKPIWVIDHDGDGFPSSNGGIINATAPTDTAGAHSELGIRLNSLSNVTFDCNDYEYELANLCSSCLPGDTPATVGSDIYGTTCKKCVDGTAVNQASNEDLFSQCTTASPGSANSCMGANCNGAGSCSYVAAGEGSQATCKRCSGSSYDPVNFADNTQDAEGSNLCNQTCVNCNGSGSCVNQTSSEDLFNQCTADECDSGDCNGSGACHNGGNWHCWNCTPCIGSYCTSSTCYGGCSACASGGADPSCINYSVGVAPCVCYYAPIYDTCCSC